MPCGWITGDEVYGGNRHLRLWLESREQPFVLAVAKNELLWWKGADYVRADQIVESLPVQVWRGLSVGAGTTGERRYDGRSHRYGTCRLPPRNAASDTICRRGAASMKSVNRHTTWPMQGANFAVRYRLEQLEHPFDTPALAVQPGNLVCAPRQADCSTAGYHRVARFGGLVQPQFERRQPCSPDVRSIRCSRTCPVSICAVNVDRHFPRSVKVKIPSLCSRRSAGVVIK